MKLTASRAALLLSLPLPLVAQTVHTVHHPATKEDLRPNDPRVPDAYAISGKFDRIVVMRMKFKSDLLHGMEDLVKKEHIQNGVILSGIGSLRGYSVHNVASRDYPIAYFNVNEWYRSKTGERLKTGTVYRESRPIWFAYLSLVLWTIGGFVYSSWLLGRKERE